MRLYLWPMYTYNVGDLDYMIFTRRRFQLDAFPFRPFFQISHHILHIYAHRFNFDCRILLLFVFPPYPIPICKFYRLSFLHAPLYASHFRWIAALRYVLMNGALLPAPQPTPARGSNYLLFVTNCEGPSFLSAVVFYLFHSVGFFHFLVYLVVVVCSFCLFSWYQSRVTQNSLGWAHTIVRWWNGKRRKSYSITIKNIAKLVFPRLETLLTVFVTLETTHTTSKNTDFSFTLGMKPTHSVGNG